MSQAVLVRDLAHDSPHRGVVHAAHSGEQVVLNLKVESADVPGEQSVTRGEVRCRFHLVDRPGAAHATLGVGEWVLRRLHDMGQLEHDAQDQTRGQVHRQVAQQEFPPRGSEQHDGDHDRIRIVERLPAEQARDLRGWVRAVACVTARLASPLLMSSGEAASVQKCAGAMGVSYVQSRRL